MSSPGNLYSSFFISSRTIPPVPYMSICHWMYCIFNVSVFKLYSELIIICYFIVFPRKVAGKCVAKGLDIRQVSIHITPLRHYPLEGTDVMKIFLGDKVQTPEFWSKSMKGSARTLVIQHFLKFHGIVYI